MNNILIVICFLFFSLSYSVAKTQAVSLKVKAFVRNNTCSVASVSQNIKIDMGIEATKLFYQPGVESRDNPFNIVLENCGSAATKVKVSLRGTPHPADNSVFTLDDPQDLKTAKNLGIAVYDMHGNRVKPNQDSAKYDLVASNSLLFSARYISTAIPVDPGQANGSFIFTLTYD